MLLTCKIDSCARIWAFCDFIHIQVINTSKEPLESILTRFILTFAGSEEIENSAEKNHRETLVNGLIEGSKLKENERVK
ncbi:hypothetical protein DASC09_055590 [Saccharomycopsis crataegensis]|uniref:Uncharacterized protein n=1 Tax=Saccharomycopsis crataegensis TaxID=43959 RepID=A0AAV5QUF2_9ASCO|nr:hypothetical protein DASC09_055590 [Saccharomycopsis crataegensis]